MVPVLTRAEFPGKQTTNTLICDHMEKRNLHLGNRGKYMCMYFRWKEVERELAEYKLREKGDPCQLEYQAQQFSQVNSGKEGKGKAQQAYVCAPSVCICVFPMYP